MFTIEEESGTYSARRRRNGYYAGDFSSAPMLTPGELSALKAFLERGVAAFTKLDNIRGFLDDIERDERRAAERLFTGHPDPFGA